MHHLAFALHTPARGKQPRGDDGTAMRLEHIRPDDEIGIAVASGMIASTCIAVVFVPSFYVVLQRFNERGRKQRRPTMSPASDE